MMNDCNCVNVWMCVVWVIFNSIRNVRNQCEFTKFYSIQWVLSKNNGSFCQVSICAGLSSCAENWPDIFHWCRRVGWNLLLFRFWNDFHRILHRTYYHSEEWCLPIIRWEAIWTDACIFVLPTTRMFECYTNRLCFHWFLISLSGKQYRNWSEQPESADSEHQKSLLFNFHLSILFKPEAIESIYRILAHTDKWRPGLMNEKRFTLWWDSAH